MKVYVADKGKTFVDEKGFNYGTTITTSNIEKYHQVDNEFHIRSNKSMMQELMNKRKAKTNSNTPETKENSKTKQE